MISNLTIKHYNILVFEKFKLFLIFNNYKLFRMIYYLMDNKYSLIKKLDLKNNFLLLDIGANKGKVSRYVLDHYKNCKIEAFEPNSYAFKKLIKNFKGYSNIKCYNKGISKDGSQMKLYYHKDDINKKDLTEASSFLELKENIDINKFEIVSTISIRSIIKKYQYIDLIKIDIEGYEYEIIQDLIDNKHKIKYVLCELHGNPKNLSRENLKKNIFLEKKYNNLIKLLEKNQLLNKWFFEYY